MARAYLVFFSFLFYYNCGIQKTFLIDFLISFGVYVWDDHRCADWCSWVGVTYLEILCFVRT